MGTEFRLECSETIKSALHCPSGVTEQPNIGASIITYNILGVPYYIIE